MRQANSNSQLLTGQASNFMAYRTRQQPSVINNEQQLMGTSETLYSPDQQSSLKGKLYQMEENLRAVSDEINFHKKEVQIIQAEKQTLENILSLKAQDVKKVLSNDVSRVDEELKRMLSQQNAENMRLQQQISTIKDEKVQLRQNLLDLKRRLEEMELLVGVDEEEIKQIIMMYTGRNKDE